MCQRNRTDKREILVVKKEEMNPKDRGILQKNLHRLTSIIYSLFCFAQHTQMVQLN